MTAEQALIRDAVLLYAGAGVCVGIMLAVFALSEWWASR